MRKFLVRLMNLIYIAAAGVSLYALCTTPMFKATVTLKFSQSQIGKLLGRAFKYQSGETEEEGEEESRVQYKSSSGMNKYIDPENIENYFPNGYTVTFPVEVSAKYAFDIKNPDLLDDLIQGNLHIIADKLVDSLIDPLNLLFKDIVRGYAYDTLSAEINKQIAEKYPGAAPASQEEIDAVFEDVYGLLEEDGEVTVDELAEAILHGGDHSDGVLALINSRGGKFVAWSPQPQPEEVEADRTAAEGEEKYYVEHLTYVHNTNEYSSSVAYFNKVDDTTYELYEPQPTEEEVEADRTAAEGEEKYYVAKKSYTHNTDAYDAGTEYFERQPYSSDEINDEKISEQIVNSLEGVDGLVSLKGTPCDPQPSKLDVEADIAKENQKERIYYILDSNNEYVLPTEYQAVTYYTVEKIVNDIDTAMSSLIDSFLNGNSSSSNGGRAVVREEEPKESTSSSSSKETLEAAFKEYLYNKIPQNITEKTGTVGKNAPYILLAIIALFALPWAWFILVTLLRTFRKTKCYTRVGIIVWGALIQVALGFLLTYGGKRGWGFVASRVDALKEYANAINMNLTTGCLIPSIMWVIFAVTAIPYMILRRPLIFEHKMIKRIQKKEAFQRERERYIRSKER